ncbi:hypothetical protein ACHAPT_004016 [Fusarium lateritium]
MPEDTMAIRKNRGKILPLARSISLMGVSFSESTREEFVNKAHYVIEVFERRLVILENSTYSCQSGEALRVKYARGIMELNRSVNNCLFGNQSLDLAFVKQFDKIAIMLVELLMGPSIMAEDYEIKVSNKRPEVEFLALGNSDAEVAIVPYPMSSYDAMTNSEFRHSARRTVEVLESRLCAAKEVILNWLPDLNSLEPHLRKWTEAQIHEIFEQLSDLALFRGYVDKLPRTQIAWTSFMFSKFDRATLRLYCRMPSDGHPRLRGPPISCFDDDDDPRGLEESMPKIKDNQGTHLSLLKRAADMEKRLNSQGKPSKATAEAIALMELDRSYDHGVLLIDLVWKLFVDPAFDRRFLIEVLGQDFVETILATAHYLVKADIPRLRKINSQLEELLGLSPEEAAAEFPTLQFDLGPNQD